jgi:hypothetical protein
MAVTIRNQDDLVKQFLATEPKVITEKLKMPGIETLHQKRVEEIAETLAIVLKSKAKILEMKYRVGEYLEVTYET